MAAQATTTKGHVDVPMGETGASDGTISTSGLTGCYGFLIDGQYRESSFCWLDHHSFTADPGTSEARSLLRGLIQYFIKEMKKCLKKVFELEPINLKHTKKLSLLVTGGVHEYPDDVRIAFSLFYSGYESDLRGIFEEDTEGYHLINNLQYKTAITAPVGYLLSDRTEEIARAAGLGQNDVIQPAFVWIDYDCQSKICNLGVRWESAVEKIDLALLDITITPRLKPYYESVLQHEPIQNFKRKYRRNENYIALVNEAIGRFLRTMFRYSFNLK